MGLDDDTSNLLQCSRQLKIAYCHWAHFNLSNDLNSGQNMNGLELTVIFPTPSWALIPKDGSRSHFSIYSLKLMLRPYVLTQYLAYQHSVCRLKPSYAI